MMTLALLETSKLMHPTAIQGEPDVHGNVSLINEGSNVKLPYVPAVQSVVVVSCQLRVMSRYDLQSTIHPN